MKTKYTIYLKNRNFEGFVSREGVDDIFIISQKEKATRFESPEEATEFANDQLKDLGDCSIVPIDS